MRRRWIQAVWMAAVVSSAQAAWATHPDYEGERGVEAHLALGYGTYTSASDRVFFAPSDVSGTALGAFTGGFNARVGLGYRMLPYMSAGLTVGIQYLQSQGQFSPTEQAFGASDSFVGYTVGAYARLYLGSLLNGARSNPRVFFRSAGDLRRFDPFVSLGVEFAHSIQRSRSYSAIGHRDDLTSWTASYVGIPIVLGAEYRVLPQLALGLNLGFTPVLGTGVTKLSEIHTQMAGTDDVMRTSVSYTPDSPNNLNIWFGLTARYTFTF